MSVNGIKNLSTSNKLILMTTAVLLLPVLSLGYLALEIRKANEDILGGSAATADGSRLIEDQAEILSRLELVNDLAQTFTEIQYWISDLALGQLTESEDRVHEKQAEFVLLLTQLEPHEPRWVGLLSNNAQKYLETMMSAVDCYAHDNGVSGNSLIGDGRRLAAEMNAHLEKLLSETTTRIREVSDTMARGNQAAMVQNASIVDKNTQLLRVSMALPVIATVVGLLAAVATIRMIVKPLKTVVHLVKDLAQGEGDLTQRINLNRRDEIGQLGKWFDVFVQKIHDIITEVGSATTAVANSATSIASVSEDISRGMEEQSAETVKVSSAIEQMSASIIEVARKSGEAASNAADSGRVAREGGDAVDQTIKDMLTIDEAVSCSAISVAALGKRGEQIGQIIEVINDIADQTNLLALNAAIEAARAGEHGRGFAVVADEVRKLADRTTKATAKVSQSIKAIQAETLEAVQRMDTGTDQVKAGVGRAKQAGQALRLIVEKAQDVAGMIQSIAAETEQQTAASEHVSESITSISAITEKVAREGGGQAADSVNGLVQRSTQLQSLLNLFKLRTDVTGESAKWTRLRTDPVRLLLVDDDSDILRLLEHHLKDRGDCTLASGGREACSAFKALLDQGRCYDLVCLDINMPDMDGRDVLSQLRQLEQTFGIPDRHRSKVAIITSLDTPQDMLRAFSASCETYINKPLSKEKLLASLETMGIRRPPGNQKAQSQAA